MAHTEISIFPPSYFCYSDNVPFLNKLLCLPCMVGYSLLLFSHISHSPPTRLLLSPLLQIAAILDTTAFQGVLTVVAI